jgi:putative hemolysin
MTVKSVSMQSGKSKSNISASGIRFDSGEMMNGNVSMEEVREAESSTSEAEQQNRESRASLSLQGILNEDVEAQVANPIEATSGGWSEWLFCCCWWMDSGDIAKPRTYIARRPPTTHVLEPLHRYCDKDGFLKPYRAHHCRNCGTCVLKYDHHCPCRCLPVFT